MRLPFAHITFRTLVQLAVVLLILGAFISYAGFQARFLIAGPTIHLTQEPETMQRNPTVELSGTASNIVALTLNGRDIFTDDSGHFTETLVLPTGYTIMTLEARDRYGRTTQLERAFVYTKDITSS